MRVNVYAEEMTDRIEIVEKEAEGQKFTGVRFYLELPVTMPNTGNHIRGPFLHGPGDDDSAAVTFWGKSFWGKRDLRALLVKAVELLDEHYLKPEYERSTRPSKP
jgi:hypothetical protein